MFLVGLTGGISTGKSSVALMLRSMGVEVIDADIVAREVVEPQKRAWRRIRKEFGDAVFHTDGSLNRKAMAAVIFAEPDKRKLLNSITHPEIYKSIFWKCLKLFFSGHQFAVIDLPLLFESGQMVKYLHKTIVVACEPHQQIERLMNRDKLSESEALARINAQMPLQDKIKLADFVIYNNDSEDLTKNQIQSVVSQLRNFKTHWRNRIIFGSCVIIFVTIISGGTYSLWSLFKH
ncbi:dephospho-CoA kinase domain-containing protein-like [Uloborus diversus]|uniref:dephospho-CoA kinase domain-containing protein-like n=1 Tax=Uloborus diversus TaxID=327109 RepID=UPI00240A0BB5|nr:dephospho-CoA kinase domain-containing protein-like [Uloborus diversus]